MKLHCTSPGVKRFSNVSISVQLFIAARNSAPGSRCRRDHYRNLLARSPQSLAPAGLSENGCETRGVDKSKQFRVRTVDATSAAPRKSRECEPLLCPRYASLPYTPTKITQLFIRVPHSIPLGLRRKKTQPSQGCFGLLRYKWKAEVKCDVRRHYHHHCPESPPLSTILRPASFR